MIKLLYSLLILSFAAIFPAMAQEPAKTILRGSNDEPVSFSILAEQQLALPLTEIVRIYSLRRGVTMLTAFGDSPTQAQKLLDGESGDIFITSFPDRITDLRQRGMVDAYALSVIASDRLVLAARKSDELGDRRQLLAALALQPALLANPERYIEGKHGRNTLNYLYYDTPMPAEPEIYASRQSLYRAIRNWGGIGIILQSEATRIEDIDLTVPIAETSYPPIRYTALVIAGDNMQIARDFIAFMRSREAQDIFLHHGFSPP